MADLAFFNVNFIQLINFEIFSDFDLFWCDSNSVHSSCLVSRRNSGCCIEKHV